MPRNIKRPLPPPLPPAVAKLMLALTHMRGMTLTLKSQAVIDLADSDERRTELMRLTTRMGFTRMRSIFVDNPHTIERLHKPQLWIRFEWDVV